MIINNSLFSCATCKWVCCLFNLVTVMREFFADKGMPSQNPMTFNLRKSYIKIWHFITNNDCVLCGPA